MRISDWSSDVCSSDLNIVLEEIARFRVQRELEVTTPFRQIEAEIESLPQDGGVPASIERAALEQEARRFAESQGYAVAGNAVAQLDDEEQGNGIGQIDRRSAV